VLTYPTAIEWPGAAFFYHIRLQKRGYNEVVRYNSTHPPDGEVHRKGQPSRNWPPQYVVVARQRLQTQGLSRDT